MTTEIKCFIHSEQQGLPIDADTDTIAAYAERPKKYTVNATVSLLQLNGIKFNTNTTNTSSSSKASRLSKRISTKYFVGRVPYHANVGNEDIAVSSPPLVKVVVSFRQHGQGKNNTNNRSKSTYVPSYPMNREAKDEDGNLILSCTWPGGATGGVDEQYNGISLEDLNFRDDITGSSVRLSRDVQKVSLGSGGESKVSMPALVSLKVGLLFPDDTEIHPLGVATVILPTNDTPSVLELSIPVETDTSGKYISTKKGLAKLKTTSRKLFPKDASTHRYKVTSSTMLKLKLAVDVPQAENEKCNAKVNSVRDVLPVVQAKPPISQLLREKLAKLTSSKSKDDSNSDCTLPEVMVVAPSPDRYVNATKIVLSSSDNLHEIPSHGYECPSTPVDLETKLSKTICSQDSSSCESTQPPSAATPEEDSFQDEPMIQINTIYESVLETSQEFKKEKNAPDTNVKLTPSPASDEVIFAEDVTSQLEKDAERASISKLIAVVEENIVDTFSGPVNMDTDEEEDSYEVDILFQSLEEGDVSINDVSQRFGMVAEDRKVKDENSAILVHADEKSGVQYDVEISLEGEESAKRYETQRVHLRDPFDLPKVHPTWLHEHSIKNFEGGVIEFAHTSSDLGDLTVDSSFDVVSVFSKSLKVATNKKHPQRKEALSFVNRFTCNGGLNCSEMIDDAVEGWKDIVTADVGERNITMCDGGEGRFADDTSDAMSLNTVDENGVCERSGLLQSTIDGDETWTLSHAYQSTLEQSTVDDI
jgi:hypothetical protein